jgi:hypothetical protein
MRVFRGVLMCLLEFLTAKAKKEGGKQESGGSGKAFLRLGDLQANPPGARKPLERRGSSVRKGFG